MSQEVLEAFHEPPSGPLRKSRRVRSNFFITWAVFYWVTSLVIIVVAPMAMATGVFFSIFNRSNYVEVADLFLQADFYLQGHCLTFVDHTVQCKKVPFYETFYKMPYWGDVKGRMTLTDLSTLLQTVSVQNPIVFDLMFLTELSAVVCVIASIFAWKRMTRKSIAKVIVASGVLLIFMIATTIAADQIYEHRLADDLDQTITVEVTKNEQTLNVTGRLSDIGIRFSVGNGMQMVYGLLVMCIVLVAVSVRWIFDGIKDARFSSQSTRIRTVYF